MGIHVVDLVGLDASVDQRDGGGPRRLEAVGSRLDHVIGVRGRPVAEDLGVRPRATPSGDLGLLEHEQRGALAHDEPVPSRIERPGGLLGSIVRVGRQGPDDVERPEREGAERDLGAAGDGPVDRAVPDGSKCLAEGHRAGRAGVRRREDRAADVEGDAEVRRRRSTEHGEREVRGDGPDAACEIALVLGLGVRDAAEGAAEIDPDAFPLRGAGNAGREPRVLERQPPGNQPELAEPLELPRGLRRHVVESVEVVDLGGDLRAERRWIEAVDPANRRSASPHAVPERHPARPDRRDDAETGDPDATRPAHETALVASAIDLKVASVRPAIGRTNSRSTIVAQGLIRGLKSCSMATRQPSAVGSIRQVTSIPPVGPPTWRNRSRRSAASVQVRARQATGTPSPSHGTRVRTATNRARAAPPSARRSTRTET